MAQHGNQNGSRPSSKPPVESPPAGVSPPSSLDELLAALTPVGENRPPQPDLGRAESEIDSRPPQEVEAESFDPALGDPLFSESDPFSDDLQFDFQDDLFELDDSLDFQSPDDQGSSHSPPLPEFDNLFVTSLGEQVEVEVVSDSSHAPESPEASPYEMSRTPSGQPLSLQPHEEFSFSFDDESNGPFDASPSSEKPQRPQFPSLDVRLSDFEEDLDLDESAE
jgi:hypothetical protein